MCPAVLPTRGNPPPPPHATATSDGGIYLSTCCACETRGVGIEGRQSAYQRHKSSPAVVAIGHFGTDGPSSPTHVITRENIACVILWPTPMESDIARTERLGVVRTVRTAAQSWSAPHCQPTRRWAIHRVQRPLRGHAREGFREGFRVFLSQGVWASFIPTVGVASGSRSKIAR